MCVRACACSLEWSSDDELSNKRNRFYSWNLSHRERTIAHQIPRNAPPYKFCPHLLMLCAGTDANVDVIATHQAGQSFGMILYVYARA